MHEMAMVRSVVDIVLEEAEHAGATEVLGVYLTVGYSRDIVEDVFESMFAWMCRGTVAEGAVLHLTRVPFTVRCEECGRIFPVNTRCRDTPRCPQCGASHYRLHSGMEFYVNDIEVKTDPTAVRAPWPPRFAVSALPLALVRPAPGGRFVSCGVLHISLIS